MSKWKRAGAWLLAAALVVGTLPAAGAAVTSDNAKSYLKAIDSNPGANSYLVDFDGDGSDELLLVWRSYPEGASYQSFTGGYAVWQGSKKLVQVDDMTQQYWQGQSEKVRNGLGITSCFIAEKENRLYFVEDIGEMDCGTRTKTYTVRNGQWILVDTMYDAMWAFAGIDSSSINGQDVDQATFQNAYAAYQSKQELTDRTSNNNFKPHSVKEQLANAVDTSVFGYEDVLSSLSESEKKALFEDLLFPFAGYDIDYRTATDQQIAQVMNAVWYDHNKYYSGWETKFTLDLPNYDVGIPKDLLDPLTNSLFGRTLNLDKLARKTLPSTDDTNNFCYSYQNALCFHAYFGMGSFPGYIKVIPEHFYNLGNQFYYAVYTEKWLYDDTGVDHIDNFSFVIKKNADNSYRLVRIYPAYYTPTAAELATFVQPSSWAKAEVEKAQAANLVPELTGAPGWQDSATRLQFAELIVQFVEQATGKTLTAAPSGTFSDTNSEAVLKAHAAGIVNGTSDTAFSPYDPLTRQELATMLWRAISYVQTETGKTALAAGGSLSGYTDAGKVSAWAKDAVSALAQNGIMKGTSGTTLSPASSCTVEQSVLLVYRTFQKLQ
ncbi:S-layer homology domain-containing protein [Agathobaculum sp.]|uniref:S-layer homology domain-containing protein n=1 Tax=Agathobaculum sp. TaxID=2048138 RepID=UPI002A837E14|nr:S-layer homology domain-containing protein [Agathobaculum sp.]MDY3619005.1 S-layer homology domain-containing protein [Agathobaculum sp.]